MRPFDSFNCFFVQLYRLMTTVNTNFILTRFTSYMFRSLLPQSSLVTVSVCESETNRSMASISSAAAHLSRSRGPLLFLSSPSSSAVNRPACLRISSLPGAHSIKKSNDAKRYGCRKIPSPTLRCSAQLLGDLAPATSAAYGTLLLGGGLFACNP